MVSQKLQPLLDIAGKVRDGLRKTRPNDASAPEVVNADASAAPAAAVDLTSVPAGISLGRRPRAVRLNKTALYVALSAVFALGTVAFMTAPENKRKELDAPGVNTNPEKVQRSKWYADIPDYYVSPEKPKAPEPSILQSNGTGAMGAGNLGLPPPPPLTGANGGNAPNLLPAPHGGSTVADPRLSSAPMAVYTRRAAANGAGGADGGQGQGAASQVAQANIAMPQGTGAGAAQAGKPLEPLAQREVGQGVEQSNPYRVDAGWDIPAVLTSGISSDIPGRVTAQVAENVFDSRTGKHLLVPMGSRLIGTYNSGTISGQERLQVSWVMLTLPDGTQYDISGMDATDSAGYAGMTDRVNNHYGRLVTSAFLMSVFGVQSQMAAQNNVGADGKINAQGAIAAAMAQQTNATANQLLQRELRVAPTLEIRPGYRFNVLVARNLIVNKPFRQAAYR